MEAAMDDLRGLRKSLIERIVALPWIAAVLDDQSLDIDSYRNYLVCAYKYAEHSPVVMALAGARTITSHPAIGSYLLHHAEEEAGHYLWAREDLADLDVDDDEIERRWPQTSCAAMIAVMHHTASVANPVGLLGWMYMLESVGEDLGTVAAEGLAGALAGSPALRFVAAHGVTDVGHAQEMDAVIETNVIGAQDWKAVLSTAQIVADLQVGMYSEVQRTDHGG